MLNWKQNKTLKPNKMLNVNKDETEFMNMKISCNSINILDSLVE